jgi:poly(3-hydroxybutyrate) depolymerase
MKLIRDPKGRATATLALCIPALFSLAACDAANVDELTTVSSALTVVYEAEAALLSGPKISTAHAGFTGTGFADYQAATGDFIEWTVSAASAGAYTLTFRYANGGGASRPLSLKINGAVANPSLAFPATGGWGKWATVTTTANLVAGSNKVRTTAIGSSGGDLDNLQVTSPSNPVLAVKPTAGCGLAPTQATGSFVKYTISTSGTKPVGCADSVCGPWTLARDYYVSLPVGYDPSKAYPLVFQMTGCGGTGRDVYPLTFNGAASVNNTVIRVGLTPPPNSIGHSTNPNQGCYDDKEGDDSVDFVFYEKLRDLLKTQFCYDDNRVFASGNSSGSWMANEMACKYSGTTAGYAIRGIAANTGGLPSDPKFSPVCTTKPMAGMWVHEIQDPTNPFTGTKFAVNRAMSVNGCTIGTSYDTAQFDNYPIGGGNADTTCKLIKGCPAIYPLVVCALPGNGHGSHDNVTNPGFSTFISGFSAGPFINN